MKVADSNNAGVAASPTAIQTTSHPQTEVTLPHPTLPEEPLVIIGDGRPQTAVSLRELWAHRELLYFLVWRDLKVRYRQATLGVAWVVIQPLAMTLIFTLFLGMLARVPSAPDIPCPLFVYVGLLPWTFFSGAVSVSSNSLVGNTHLITKVYFPRLIVPAAAVGGRLIDFGIALVILAGLMAYYRVTPTRGVLMLPVLAALLVVLSLGCGMLLSALNVKYRDIGIVVPVVLQLWMFASPTVYPASLVPETWQWLYILNPLVGIIEGFRAALFGRAFDWAAIAAAAGVTLPLFIFSAHVFRRMEKIFADVI